MKNKVKNINQLLKIIKKLKKLGKKIVFTNGCFDILHIGHIRYLKKAKKLGDVLIVAVNSDKSVRILKGKGRPVLPQNERVEILAEFPFIDFITIFNGRTPLNIIKRIIPDVLVKGGDWKVQDIVGNEVVKNNKGEVISIPLVKGKSTTNILKRILYEV